MKRGNHLLAQALDRLLTTHARRPRDPQPGDRRPSARRSQRAVFPAAIAMALIVGSALSAGLPLRAVAASSPCAVPVVNPVVCENTLPGDPATDWQVSGSGDAALQGFATDISSNVGSTVQFKINDGAGAYHLDILRIGYYQGNGARKVAAGVAPTASLPQPQPACLSDAASGLTDCGNWAVSASWTIPANAASGVYMAHLVRDDTGTGSLIPFIVRNDTSRSALLFQTSDSTWQAYNRFGGNDFYIGSPAPPVFGLGRSYAVSYNRPIITSDCCEEDWFFHAEYPMVRFLEQNGYDVSYTTDVDSDRNGPLIKQHKVLVTAGHDEYWSGNQRANVTAARDAGVSLAFFSGNNIYWKTRYAPTIDGSNAGYRTIYCYKETWAGAQIDPQGPATWTGTWRDPRFSPPADGGAPENALAGTIFMVNVGTMTIQVPFKYAGLRIWRNTAVARLQPGQTASLATDTLGYEWNEDVDNGFRPAGLFDMSSTTGAVPQALLDYGQTVGPATATHSITEYRAPSGALVFSAGTIQWAWGLDDNHTGDTLGTIDAAMQQATINLFADMGAQPATLMAGMVASGASTDTTAPASTITVPGAGSTAQTNTPVTVTGTAHDLGGGVVAGVEISTDGGTTWHPATGTTAWTYSWTPTTTGVAGLRSRAVDDSGNLESPAAATSVTVTTACPCSLWTNQALPDTPTADDTASTELGVRFQTAQAGFISGIRFYKGAGNTGTHIGTLWSTSGSNLASVTFTGESASGWQTAAFAAPVAVAANTAYVASYLAPNGGYSSSMEYFCTKGVSAGPLQAPADASSPGCGTSPGVTNGLYSYSSGVTLPTDTYESTNYWVDVVYAPAAGPSVIATTPTAGATGVADGTAVTVTFNAVVNPASLAFTLTDPTGSRVPAAVTYPVGSTTATLQPGSALGAGQVYTGSVQATDTTGHPMGSPFVWSFTVAGTRACPCSIWSPGAAPAVAAANDPGAVELGVKFKSDAAGYISGVRFYKGAGNTGTHIGNLWTSSGTRLATATFSNETASGWQQVNFASQMPVSAGATYVASYFAPSGHYAADSNYFGVGYDSAPLHAPSSPASGGDGTYVYGSASAFPQATYNATNYWVDVVFTTQQDLTPPTVTVQTPTAGAGGVAIASPVSATFSRPVQATSIAFQLKSWVGTAVTGGATYDAATQRVTFTPAAQLAYGTSYLATVSATGVNGTAMAQPSTWSFTTQAQGCFCSILGNTAPAVADFNDPGSVNLGVKFTADVSGHVAGVRFYKSAANTGVHTGSIWTASGALLATATFSGETASGWQTVAFATPVAVTAGTTYVASYLAPKGHYAATGGAFASVGVDSPPLHALSSSTPGGNGVYAYNAATAFPSNSYNATNYWVDVVFTTP